jgi:hypothetical protein
VFFGLGAFSASGHQRCAQLIFGCAIAGILLVLHIRTAINGNVYIEVLAAAAGGVLLGTLLFPTYIRLVPGRMDVLQCGFLGRAILSKRSIELRGRKVVVDLSTRVVTVGTGGETPPIGYAAMWDGPEFVNAVLQACVSTHTPPALPEDALVG